MQEDMLTVMEEQCGQLPAMAESMRQMTEMVAIMAATVRSMSERVDALTEQVRTLTKVTPSQVKALNAAIRCRASEICGLYRCNGAEKAVAGAIRKAVRLSTGVTALRDLPRTDYAVADKVINLWEDRTIMKRIREEMLSDGR